MKEEIPSKPSIKAKPIVIEGDDDLTDEPAPTRQAGAEDPITCAGGCE